MFLGAEYYFPFLTLINELLPIFSALLLIDSEHTAGTGTNVLLHLFSAVNNVNTTPHSLIKLDNVIKQQHQKQKAVSKVC